MVDGDDIEPWRDGRKLVEVAAKPTLTKYVKPIVLSSPVDPRFSSSQGLAARLDGLS